MNDRRAKQNGLYSLPLAQEIYPAADILEPHMARLRDWAASLPPLPPGYQYRFESTKFDINGAVDETELTLRAVPERVLNFED